MNRKQKERAVAALKEARRLAKEGELEGPLGLDDVNPRGIKVLNCFGSKGQAIDMYEKAVRILRRHD